MQNEGATTADRWLVQAMESNGWGRDDAIRAVEGVTAGILGQLREGRGVTLAEIGRLKPGKWRETQPALAPDGSGFRETAFRHPVMERTSAIGRRDCGPLVRKGR